MTFTPESSFTLKSGEGDLIKYNFNKHLIDHVFCKTCGVQSFAHGQDGEGNKMVAINVNCLENFDIDSIEIQKYDRCCWFTRIHADVYRSRLPVPRCTLSTRPAAALSAAVDDNPVQPRPDAALPLETSGVADDAHPRVLHHLHRHLAVIAQHPRRQAQQRLLVPCSQLPERRPALLPAAREDPQQFLVAARRGLSRRRVVCVLVFHVRRWRCHPP